MDWLLGIVLIPVAGVVGWWRLPPEREFAGLAAVLCMLAVVGGGVVFMLLGAPCGPDSGAPYAAGSPAARFCNGIGEPAFALLPSGAVLVGAALRRLLNRRGALWVFFVAGLAGEFGLQHWPRHLLQLST